MRSIGMLATSWPWPYAPRGVPALTKCMVRADPGDHFDGVGWSQPTLTAANKVENEYSCGGRTSWRRRRRTPAARTTSIRGAPAHRRPGMAPTTAATRSTRTSRREVNGEDRSNRINRGGAILSLFMVSQAQAHKAKHTPEQLKAFEDVFMEQGQMGDLLFHGDEATQKKLGVQLTKTGMACAMCHPFGTDNHPAEFPSSRSRSASSRRFET